MAKKLFSVCTTQTPRETDPFSTASLSHVLCKALWISLKLMNNQLRM